MRPSPDRLAAIVPTIVLVIIAVISACGAGRPAVVTRECPTDRGLVISGQDDITRFAGCERAVGVTIRTGMPLDTRPLAALAEITGNLEVGPSLGLDELSLQGLARVGGTLKIASNSSISGVYLPKLEQVGQLVVDGNSTLTTLSMPRLARVLGAMTITDCATLGLIEASSLVTVGGELTIAHHPELTLLELGALERAAAIRIEDTPRLPAERVEQLRAKLATP